MTRRLKAALFRFLGYRALRLQNLRAALANFGKAAEQQPENPNFALQIAWCLYRLENYEAAIEKYDAPIMNATTKSLDALKSYSLGMVTRRRQGEAPSLPFFRKAIEQDPYFALAHARLSTVLSNLGESQPSIDEIRKAYELKDRVSEPERLYILARYNGTV